jgi:hypothetical protein
MAEVGDRQESYLNVRVRLQRLPDAKFYSGWVRMMSDSEIVIDYHGHDRFEPNTHFFVSVNGVETAALFPAELISQSTGFLTLRITKEIKYTAPREEARRQIVGLSGVIDLEGTEIEFSVTDISARGLGGVLEGNIPRGSIVNLALETQFGTIKASSEVRYCRRETTESVRHRIGLKILNMGRIETARWLRLSEDKVA